MENMNIGVMGRQNVRSAEDLSFDSKYALFDFDLLFLDLNYIAIDFAPYNQNENHYYKVESFNTQKPLVNIFKNRKIELQEFINSNKYLIVTTPIPQIVYSSNAQGYSFTSLLPLDLSVEHKEGSRIDVIQKTKFTEFFQKHIHLFRYHSYFKNIQGVSLLNIKGTQNCVSFFYKNILFVPPLDDLEWQDETDIWDELVSIFVKKEIVENINLPEWSKKYNLPSEKTKRQDITSIENQITELLCKKELNQNELQFLISKKTLFCGTGTCLENEVEKIFSEIGFEIHDTDEHRADLLIKYNNKIAVVEIKGLSGSAGEKNAAQLEKWVTNYYADNDVHPKGILLVNSFREIELDKRPEVTFPHQMLKYAKQREHCLLTSLQLLGLSLEIKNNPSKKDELIESLFSTIGIYKGFTDWNRFLEIDASSSINQN